MTHNPGDNRRNEQLLSAVLWDLGERHRAAVAVLEHLEAAAGLERFAYGLPTVGMTRRRGTPEGGLSGRVREARENVAHLERVMTGETAYHVNVAGAMSAAEVSDLMARYSERSLASHT